MSIKETLFRAAGVDYWQRRLTEFRQHYQEGLLKRTDELDMEFREQFDVIKAVAFYPFFLIWRWIGFEGLMRTLDALLPKEDKNRNNTKP